MELIILAAGKGSRIFKKINKNKCLISIKGVSLIEKIVKDALSTNLFKKIKVVVGYRKSKIKEELKKYNILYIDNKDFDKKEMLHSLKLGILDSNDDVVITYSDIIFSKKIFFDISKNKIKNYILPIFKNWKSVWRRRKKNIISDCESLVYDKNFNLTEIGNKINSVNEPMGQFMGIFYIPKNKLKKTISLINKNSSNKKIHTTNFINFISQKKEKILCIPCGYNWYEIDDIEDYRNFIRSD